MCPAGHPSIEEYELKDAPERVEVHFAGTTCEPCPCDPLPSEAETGVRGLRPQGGPGEGEHRAASEGRGHRGVAQAVWHKGWYRGNELRAEARHGLGRLRVRGGGAGGAACRYLKALACNFKRMVHARLVEMENTARAGAGTCGRGRMRAPLHNFPRVP